MKQLSILFAVLLLAACSTNRELLELRLDRLNALETNAEEIRDGVKQGIYNPEKYDAYVAIDVDVFQRLIFEAEGQTVEVDADGRAIQITVETLTTNFRPGSPEITVVATALDKSSGVKAGIELDTRIVLIRDASSPENLTAKVVATRIVPELRWGPIEFTKAKFVRALLELEASKLTDELQGFTLPLTEDFAFGSEAQTFDSGQLDTGNRSYIRGNIIVPSTLVSGQFTVKNILFLENGVHIFADLEGL